MAHVVFWLVALIAAALTGPVGFTVVLAAWVGFLVEAVRFNMTVKRWAKGWRPPAGAKPSWRKVTLTYLVLALIGAVLGGWPGFGLVAFAWVGMMIYDVRLGVRLGQWEAEAERRAALTTAELRAKMDATVERARAAKKTASVTGMSWYLLQIAAGSAAAFGVYVGFSHLGTHVPPTVVIGAAVIGALWVTIVVNRIYRLRELARGGGKGYFRTWCKEVMAAEEFLPPGAKR